MDMDSENNTSGKPDNDDSSDTTAIEILVDTISSNIFYVTTGIICDILLSECPTPNSVYAERMQPYRMPTRLEAYSLVYITVDLPTNGQRCLCYDDPKDDVQIGSSQLGTGEYYTFVWGSGNRPTKAGFKTKYCITPIRLDSIATDTIPTPNPDDDIDDETEEDEEEDDSNEKPEVPDNPEGPEEEELPDESSDIKNGITISDEETDNMQGD